MEYVLVRYKRKPEEVIGIAATASPSEAVDLARCWTRAAPDEGVIVAVGKQAIVHCAPRAR